MSDVGQAEARFDEYAHLIEELQQSDAWRSHVRFRQLRMSVDIFLANANDLLATLKALPTPEVVAALTGESEEEHTEHIMTHVMRLLFNFLSSAHSLNEHLGKFSARYPKERRIEYRKALSRWRSLDVTAVVRLMRHFFSHEEIPPPAVEWVLEPQAFDVAVTLNIDALLKWRDWSAKERKVLETLSQPGRLEHVIEPYVQAARDFLTWLYQWHQEEAEAETFEQVRQMQARILTLQREMRDDSNA